MQRHIHKVCGLHNFNARRLADRRGREVELEAIDVRRRHTDFAIGQCNGTIARGAGVSTEQSAAKCQRTWTDKGPRGGTSLASAKGIGIKPMENRRRIGGQFGLPKHRSFGLLGEMTESGNLRFPIRAQFMSGPRTPCHSLPRPRGLPPDGHLYQVCQLTSRHHTHAGAFPKEANRPDPAANRRDHQAIRQSTRPRKIARGTNLPRRACAAPLPTPPTAILPKSIRSRCVNSS